LISLLSRRIIMDNIHIGTMVLNFVSVFYKGGVESFTDHGGIISSVPFDDSSILIYHPDMPEYFEKAIEKQNNKSEIKLVIVTDLNFSGTDPFNSIKLLYDVGESIRLEYDIPVILYNPLNPLVLMISIPFADLSRDDIQAIAETFSSKVPGIIRGCLSVGHDKYPFSSGGVYEVEKKMILEPDRCVITDDTITDLKITLAGINSVEDFLRDF
jgi:hypothetical protein